MGGQRWGGTSRGPIVCVFVVCGGVDVVCVMNE